MASSSFSPDICPGESLTKYIDSKINPDTAFLEKCGKYTKDIVDFMHTVVPYSIATTIKGGSLGKGTAVKDKSDLDILFVVNDFESIDDIEGKLNQIKHELHNALCCGSWGNVNGPLTSKAKAIRKQLKLCRPFMVSDIRRTPYTVSFTMTHKDGTVMPVDLLLIPKLSAIPGKFTQAELTCIYQKMKANPKHREYYGKCLSPVQVRFVKSQPEKVKRTIRVVKDWAKTHQHKLSSYAIELLVIKKYEDCDTPKPGMITEQKLAISVFDRLKDCRNIEICWNKHYNIDDFGRPMKPYIMDPANPYHNLFTPKTEIYWIRRNETECVSINNPEFQRIEYDAKRTFRQIP